VNDCKVINNSENIAAETRVNVFQVIQGGFEYEIAVELF